MSLANLYDYENVNSGDSLVAEFSRTVEALTSSDDVEYWRHREFREAEPLPATARELALKQWGNFAEEVLDQFDSPEWLPSAGRDRQVDHKIALLCGMGARPEIVCEVAPDSVDRVRDDPTRQSIFDLLKSSANAAYVIGALKSADRVVEIRDESAHSADDVRDSNEIILDLFRHAIDSAPRPVLQNEIGAFIIRRVGIEGGQLYPHDPPVLEWSRKHPPEILWEDVISGPSLADLRRPLLDIALRAFVRAYSHFELIAAEAADGGTAKVDYYDVCNSLDGMRVIFHELGLRPELEAVYWAHYAWRQAIGGEDEDVTSRFVYSFGLARGRDEGQAVSDAERIVGVPLSSSRREDFSADVARDLKRASSQDLAECRERLAVAAGEAWPKLSDSVQSLFVQVEYLLSIQHPPGFDWAPVVMQYCRAIETHLRDTVGKSLERFMQNHQRPFSDLAEAKIGPLRKPSMWTLAEFGRALMRGPAKDLWNEFVAYSYPESKYLMKKIAGDIQIVNSDYRNPVSHGSNPMAGAKMETLKRLLFSERPGEPALIRQLSELVP